MKRSKSLRAFLTLALVAVMCLGSVATVFAAGSPVTGTEAAPAQAAITKMLRMPEGTTTPTANFTFIIAKKSLDGSTLSADLAAMPAITSKTISYTPADVGTTASGIKSVPKEANVFAGVTWPHAGVYTYTVTEQSGTYTTATGETMTYSGGSYDIAVYVANGTSGLYIAAIGTTITTVDTAAQTVGDKVDATPGGTGVTGDYSKLIFTNTFTRTGGSTPDPTDPTDPTKPANTALSISKTVSGDYGDRTKYFAYNVTLTKAGTFTTEQTYKAYVMEGTTVVTSSANYAGTIGADGSIQVTTGTPVTINLKHGQRLVFVGTVVGSSYVAVESAAADYTPSIALVANGISSSIPGTVSTSLSTSSRLIGEAANSAAYTNTYKTVTPTGISLNNLPFIMMIVLAVGALAAFVVVKSRKRV